MKAKQFYVIMALVMALSLVAAAAVAAPGPPVAAQDDMWYVSPDGDDATGDGSVGNPWRHIQFAIDNGNVTSGDTIIVDDGTYNEKVVINKSLTIQAASSPVIDGNGTLWVPAVEISAVDVTFQGFDIQNFKADVDHDLAAVYVQGDNATIDHNTIANITTADPGGDPFGIGIDVWTESGANTDIEITNNTVHDVDSIGIRVRDDWRIGQPWSGSTGISRNVLLEGNTVYSAGNSNVLITGFAEGVTVRDNEIYNSSEPNSYGIRLCIYPSNVTIEDNYIHDNYRNVVLAGTDNVTISDNTIEDIASGSINVYITNNYNTDVYEPAGFPGPWPPILGGITVDTLSTNIEITNNDILNAAYGVKIENFNATDPSLMATTTTVHYNNIDGNTDYGVENNVAAQLDAECNWWGSDYGPEDASGTVECTGPAAWNCDECDKNTEPAGELGDAVSDNVAYCPWLVHEAGVVTIVETGEQFDSIQAAIDAATGTTILVNPGYYHEQLFIDQSMTIKSVDGADVTIIDGSGLTELFWEMPWNGTWTIYPVVWIDGPQVVFGDGGEGFTITGATVYEPGGGEEEPPLAMGVGMLNRAAGCVIEDNIFGNNTIAGYMGMYDFGPSSNQILDNEFCGNDMALEIMWGGGDTISGNSFTENYLAVGLQMSNDNEIVGNTLNLNWEGIEVNGSHGTTISGNEISDTTGGTWEGMDIPGVAIELKWCNENNISGNTIFKETEPYAAEWGIRLTGSWNNDIVDNNDISECQFDGIRLQDWSNDNLVQGNEVYDCERGIAVEDSRNNYVRDNDVHDCTNAAIYLNTPGSGNEIGGTGTGQGNTVYNCGNGTLLEDSWDEMVVGNTAYNCTYGIHLVNSHGITVEDNITYLGGTAPVGNGKGIYLENSGGGPDVPSNTVRSNDISYNEEKGLVLESGSDNNFVAANKIHYNGHGIWIAGNNTSICGNNIRYNTLVEDSGVHLTADANGNEIHCNNIVDNTVRDGGDILSYGMFKDGGNATNAQHNWWGDPTGPSGIDVPGNGDAIGGPVNFSSWAKTAFTFPDTTAPVIANTAAVPDTISLLDTDFMRWIMVEAPYSIGPSYTDLIVDTGCEPCEAWGVTVDLTALLLGMLPADIDETVAGWDEGKQHEWDNWLNQLQNTDMDSRDYWDEEGQHCYWDYELWLDDLFIGDHWGDWNLTYFFEDGEELMNMVFEEFRLGEFDIPVTAFDCAGNENTGKHITLAIVDFQLPMKKGWNIRSTPISLDDNSLYSIVHLGDDLYFSSILRWNAEQERWEQYAEPPSVYYAGWYYGSTKVADALVRPLEAYYIKLNENDQLGLIINREKSEPPQRQLYVGWNLVGLSPDIVEHGFNGMPSDEALATIYLVTGGLPGWDIAVSIGEELGYNEKFYYSDIPLEKPWYGKWFHQDAWAAYAEGDWRWMTPGGGYWVFMTNPGLLAGYSYTELRWRFVPPPEGLWPVSFQWWEVNPGDADMSGAGNDTCLIYNFAGNVTWAEEPMFPFAGKEIVAIAIDSNGYIELLEDGEEPSACGNCSSIEDFWGASPDCDFIFAWMDDLDSSSHDGYYAVKYVEDREIVVIQWETETARDTCSERPNSFQLWLFPDGSVKWNFNYFECENWDYDRYAGIFDGTSDTHLDVGYNIDWWNTSYHMFGQYNPDWGEPIP